MNKKEEKTADLRKIVEKGAGAATLRNLAQMSEEDIAGLVHELETRQVELERKNHELQQTQEDLVAIRDQYAELYDFAPAGYITTDRKGLIVQSNLTFMTLLGIANRPLQKPLMEYIVAEDQKIYQSHRKTVMDTRKPQHCELRLKTKDGNSLWAGIDSVCIESSNGECEQIQSILHDISNRKRVDKEREEEHALLQTVIDGLPDQLTMTNLDYTVVMTNRSSDKNGKMAKPDAVGLKCYEVNHGRSSSCDGDKNPCPMKEVLKKKKAVTVEHVHRNAAGESISVEVAAAPVFNDNGEIVHVVESVRDITERKRVSEKNAQFMAAIGQAAEAVMITDAKAMIQYVNPAFEQITGYTSAEAVGKIPNMLKSGKHNASFYEELWETLRQGETWSGQFINKKKDGSFYTEEATISPVRDALEQTVNYVAVKRDITEEIAREEQFRQSQKMEAVGQLVGGIAHDFNNLLQVICGFADIARARIDSSDPASENINEVIKAGKRATTLVKQLLAFSRQQVILPTDLDLNEVIADGLKMLRRALPEHIEFKFVAGKNLGVVHADCGQLEQVLMNLCVNAGDAMPNGGALTLETEALEVGEENALLYPWAQPGRYVLLSITDTGGGMDQQTREHLFEPFFTTKEVGRGTGLGLSTVYGIVTQNKGHIQAHSELGKGSVFKIYLPVVDRQAIGILDSDAPPMAGGVETVLVAEDDKTILALAELTLSSAGYTVLSARDGEEAVRIFEEHAEEIDLVIMDVVMPRMGGKEALEKILELKSGLPYLFVSGYSKQTGYTDFIENRELQLLSKPYQSVDLLQKIRDTLDAK